MWGVILLVEIIRSQVASDIQELLPPTKFAYIHVDEHRGTLRRSGRLSVVEEVYNYVIVPLAFEADLRKLLATAEIKVEESADNTPTIEDPVPRGGAWSDPDLPLRFTPEQLKRTL